MLEELRKKAIVIIYEDGFIDAIDLTENDLGHIDYYKELYNYSLKLRNYCPKNLIIQKTHYPIDDYLVAQGCIVILNWDIRSDLNRDEIADLSILFPLEYRSLEQIKVIKKILQHYPEKNMMLSKYNNEYKRCKTTYLDDVLEELNTEEENLGLLKL